MEKKNKKMMIDEDLFRMLYQYFIYDREDLKSVKDWLKRWTGLLLEIYIRRA